MGSDVKPSDKLFTYTRTFNAIAAAVSVYAEGVGITISVAKFIEAFGPVIDTPMKGEGDETESQWRDLALQFDGHRIEALSMLRYISDAQSVAEATGRIGEIKAFLAKPPLSGEAVLAARLATLPAHNGDVLRAAARVAVGVLNTVVVIGTETSEGADGPHHSYTPLATQALDAWHALTDALAAAPQSPSGDGVRVKALEWDESGDRFIAKVPTGGAYTFAKSPFGRIACQWSFIGPFGEAEGHHVAWVGTPDEAKAAAQQDYEARIRSALETRE